MDDCCSGKRLKGRHEYKVAGGGKKSGRKRKKDCIPCQGEGSVVLQRRVMEYHRPEQSWAKKEKESRGVG